MRVLAFLAVLLSPALVSAQTILSPEIFGRIGIVKLWDDEGNIGTGLSIGIGGGVRFSTGIGLEGIVERHTNKRHFDSGVSFDSKALGVNGRIVKYFGAAGAQPYVGGSAGILRVNTISQFPGFSTNERTTTSGAFGGLSGLRIQATPRVSVRPEFEVSMAGEHLRIGGTVAAALGW